MTNSSWISKALSFKVSETIPTSDLALLCRNSTLFTHICRIPLQQQITNYVSSCIMKGIPISVDNCPLGEIHHGCCSFVLTILLYPRRYSYEFVEFLMLKFNIVQILKTKNHICDKQNELPESEIYFDSDLTETWKRAAFSLQFYLKILILDSLSSTNICTPSNANIYWQNQRVLSFSFSQSLHFRQW